MLIFLWISGIILALAWVSRIVDAALGMPSVADVSQPQWDRNPVSAGGNPRVSIIVPARDEEADIEQALRALLALDYDNYEVIAVNDRSTDRTGEIMERVQQSHFSKSAKGGAAELVESQNPHFSRKNEGAREMGHPAAELVESQNPHFSRKNESAREMGRPAAEPAESQSPHVSRKNEGAREMGHPAAEPVDSQSPHFSRKNEGAREMGHPAAEPVESQNPHFSRKNESAREMGHPAVLRVVHHTELPEGWLGKTHAMWTAANQASGDWLLFTDADVMFKPDSLRRALAYAESEPADHVVLFPRIIMKRPGEYMMVAFFQTMFMFGHRPWKVADPSTDDHMGVGAFNLVRRSVYDAVGTYQALRMEVLDDMKLGKVVKNAGFRQRNVFGGDLISIRWADGALGVVNNLTKNFFAVLSFQWPRTLAAAVALAFLNFGPFVGTVLAHGWLRLPYAMALGAMFAIYIGMSIRSKVPPYYFLLHPVSTALFIYTLLRSMALTLWNDGIEWRGTKYALEELRKGMV